MKIIVSVAEYLGLFNNIVSIWAAGEYKLQLTYISLLQYTFLLISIGLDPNFFTTISDMKSSFESLFICMLYDMFIKNIICISKYIVFIFGHLLLWTIVCL